jgi:peptidoglycan/xylan/chitin deacetylase (PgdA/CDA1 family)
MKPFAWPEGTRCVVFVSVNFDTEAYDLMSTTESRLFGRYSYGRYGVRAGLPRLLQFLQRRGIRATIFVTASDAVRHPDAVRALSDAGHEVAARGSDLKPLPVLGAGERESLLYARDTLATITGLAPTGFRAPGGELGASTLRLLAELGYVYDASFQDDDHPYIFAPSNSTRLVELPGVYALDDAPVYSARHTHARLMKIWREEFDALYDAGCLVPLTLHLRGDMGSTRAARIAALDGLFSHIASRPGVRFMTGAELAALTLSSGMTPEPDPVAMHQTTLSVTPYRGDLAVKPI